MRTRWIVGIATWVLLVVAFLALLGLGGGANMSLLLPFLLEYWIYSLPVLLLFAFIAYVVAWLLTR